MSVNYLPKTGTPPPQRESSGVVYDSANNKLYIYGGRSQIIYGDMWEFDLTTNIWSEMHPAGTMTPGPRFESYLVMLESSRQIVLFGGSTESGPISDVWLYDIDSEMVKFKQWKIVDTKGKYPPRAYYRSVCNYIHQGKHYLAIYGGIGRYDEYIKSLYM
jgi:hypothetical protein